MRTGLVVWEWHAFGHIPLADSYATPSNSADYDAFHLNSIEPVAGDRVLVSARDTSAVYVVDRSERADRVDARRQGEQLPAAPRRSLLLPARRPAARAQRGQPVRRRSRAADGGAVLTRADPRTRHARSNRERQSHAVPPAREATRSPTARAASSSCRAATRSSGSARRRSSPSSRRRGTLLFDASLPKDDGSYREFRVSMERHADDAPGGGRATQSPSRVSVYVSWNGATTSRAGRSSPARAPLRCGPRRSAPDRGFETRIELASSATTFVVRALSSGGRILATSPPGAARHDRWPLSERTSRRRSLPLAAVVAACERVPGPCRGAGSTRSATS